MLVSFCRWKWVNEVKGEGQARARASVRCACRTTGRSTMRPSSRAAPGDAASAARTRRAQSSASRARMQRGVDRLHLARVDAQLGAEAKPSRIGKVRQQACLVVELRRDACDRCRQAGQARSDRDAAGCIAKAGGVRRDLHVEVEREIERAEHQALRAGGRDAVHFGHAACAFDEREDAGMRQRSLGLGDLRGRLGLGQEHVGRRRVGQRREVGSKPGRAGVIDTHYDARPGRGHRSLQPCSDSAAGSGLVVGAPRHPRGQARLLSAPLASALSKRSGRVPGTNR